VFRNEQEITIKPNNSKQQNGRSVNFFCDSFNRIGKDNTRNALASGGMKYYSEKI